MAQLQLTAAQALPILPAMIVNRCQGVYRRESESVTYAIYRHSARLHCTFGCAAHTKDVMDGGEADPRHRITTVGTCECPWVSLTYT